jgi:hypothetical protein
MNFSDTYHNYVKGSHVRIDISFKNLKDSPVDINQEIVVLKAGGERVWDTKINMQLQQRQEFNLPFMLPVPEAPGSYTLTIPKDSARLVPLRNSILLSLNPINRKTFTITVAPDWEEGYKFCGSMGNKSSFNIIGQAVLCGKDFARMVDGDKEAQQLIDELKRDMSVVFLILDRRNK